MKFLNMLLKFLRNGKFLTKIRNFGQKWLYFNVRTQDSSISNRKNSQYYKSHSAVAEYTSFFAQFDVSFVKIRQILTKLLVFKYHIIDFSTTSK